MLEKNKELSFFERIMILREFFAKRQIRGSGEGRALRGNVEEDFEFVQLSDFLPEAELRCKDLGLIPIVNVEGTSATMTVYDEMSDKTVKFCTPSAAVKSGGGQLLQAIGSQISYSRRYLWYLFLDLCTHDELDEGLYIQGLPQKPMEQKRPIPTPAQGPAPAVSPAPSYVMQTPQMGGTNPPQMQAQNIQQMPPQNVQQAYPQQQMPPQAPVQSVRPPVQQMVQPPQGQVQGVPPYQGVPQNGMNQQPVAAQPIDSRFPYLEPGFINQVSTVGKVKIIELLGAMGVTPDKIQASMNCPIADVPVENLRLIYLVNENERRKPR